MKLKSTGILSSNSDSSSYRFSGLIGTGLAAFITFWGLNSRKDISNIIQNEYKTQINNEIAHIIGCQGQPEWYLLRLAPSGSISLSDAV